MKIEINTFWYAIRSIHCQLTLETKQRNLVEFFSKKMIPAKTWYKTQNKKLLAIVEVFKTLCHYLESCKHEVLVLMNHNHLRRFMPTKNLCSRQVRWAQELFQYHFCINYCQSNFNGATNALSQFSQQSPKEDVVLWVKNTQILYRLQLLLKASVLDINLSAKPGLLLFH